MACFEATDSTRALMPFVEAQLLSIEMAAAM
jgi:hypothetical protein